MSQPLAHGFVPAHTRAQIACALLIANAGLAAVALILNLLAVFGVTATADAIATLEEEINLYDLLHGLVGLLQLVVFISTVVVFLMWLHRAYRNLRAFGVRTEEKPGWAVGYWFIPILNLFRPYQVVKELWVKSDPAVDYSQGFPVGDPTHSTGLVTRWWLFWLVSNFVDRIYGRLAWNAETPDALSTAARIGVASDVLTIVAAAFAFMVVRTIDRMQTEKAAQLRVSQWPTPPPPPASFDAPPSQTL